MNHSAHSSWWSRLRAFRYRFPVTLPGFIYLVLLKPRWLRRPTDWILRKIIPDRIRHQGTTIVLNKSDPLGSGALWVGHHEEEELRHFSQNCHPGMGVLDIGANVGFWTALAARLVGPQGRVLAFEPDPSNFQCLQATLAANSFSWVEPYPLAASDQAGSIRLYLSEENCGDHRIYPHAQGTRSLDIQAVRLDDFLGEKQVSRVDLIKIDVQGAEAKVLSGLSTTLARHRPLIFFEFWPCGLRQMGNDPVEDVLRYLERLSYQLHRIDHGGIHALDPDQFTSLIESLPHRLHTNIFARPKTPAH